jgi:hypothetical protein
MCLLETKLFSKKVAFMECTPLFFRKIFLMDIGDGNGIIDSPKGFR